ncbi:MAG: efflux RND transporter permease subunit [Pseudopedobacter sp.]|nr:efflux RND transporter permease subunit [Deinococcales bacterium]
MSEDLKPQKIPKTAVGFFVERFVFSVAVFLAIALFGLLTVPRIGVDLLPRFEVPVVAVSVGYPGAGPEEVANQISKPIEDALTTLDGIDSIASTSSEGNSLVIIQFKSDKSVNQASVDVSQRVATIQGTLPKEANSPGVQKFDPASQPILAVALSAPGQDLSLLSDYARDTVKPLLQRVVGVADLQIQGAPDRQVQVLLNPSKLQSYGINPSSVTNAIGASSFAQSAGNRNINGQRNLFTLRTTAVTPQDVEKILVDPARGLQVTDVAVVRQTSADVSTLSRVNGQPVVSLSVRKIPDSNSVQVSKNLRSTLDKVKLPAGYKLQIVSDTTVSIEATVNDTWKEVVITIIAVSLVTLIFLGKLNTVFAVVLAIPISLLGAIIVFGLLGFTFNIISLLAITVAVGIVVDDSIVVAENVERYRKMGYGLKESVLKGAGEVVSAVSAASLSLLAVFIPISFLPGIVGQFFREFGLVLAAAVAFSWLEALFFLTVRMAYTPDPETKPISKWFKLERTTFWSIVFYPFIVLVNGLNWLADKIHGVSEAGFVRLQNGYARALSASLKRPSIVLILSFLLFLSLGYVGPRIPFNFTPKQDSGIINLTLELPKGTALGQTNAITQTVEAYLLSKPELDVLETTVGSGGGGGGSAAERAELTVNLKPKNEREPIEAVIDRYRIDINKLLEKRPDVQFKAAVPQGGPPQGADYEVTLNAPTPELLETRSNAFLNLLRRDGRFVEIRSSLSETTPEQVFIPDNSKLSGSGITPLDIAGTLRTYNAGTTAAKLRKNGREQDIVVKVDPTYAQNESDLLSLPIFSQTLGGAVPLGSLGRFEARQSPASLSRRDQAYSTGIQANFAPDVKEGLLQIQRSVATKLEEAKILDQQVSIDSSGSAAFVGDLASAAPVAFGLALLLNYLVIASQFNSFRYPLYLLIPVPLALIGAFWLAYFLGTGLDVISVLATVLLIGLVTKNAILLLDFVVRSARGIDLRSALVEAGRLRLKPILMTTATVFIISFPLILGTGEGGELRRPLGVIILGGLLTATLLTLFVVPSAFYLFERKRYSQAAKDEERERPSSTLAVPSD